MDASLDYLQRLSAEADGDPELALDMADAYLRIARVQGVPLSENLGQADKAEQSLRTAERLLHMALLRNPDNQRALLRSAQIAHDRRLLARARRTAKSLRK